MVTLFTHKLSEKKKLTMPFKLDWKFNFFSRSCVDLSSTRNDRNDSEIIVAVGFHGSQLALGPDKVESKTVSLRRRFSFGQNGRRSSLVGQNGRCSLPPEDSIVELCKAPRRKPDVVHWKAKVRKRLEIRGCFYS